MLAGARIDPDLWSLHRHMTADAVEPRAALSLALRRTTIMAASKPFWMISGTGTGMPTVRHDSYERAEAEAKRLARNNPGVEYVVLKSEQWFRKPDVESGSFASEDGLHVTVDVDPDDLVASLLEGIFGADFRPSSPTVREG